jgi:hypothetical protein
VLEDHRCLGSPTCAQDVEGAMASNDASVGESQPLSQLPYGTQMLHPLSARPSEEGPQLLVVNRAEPTLAGNTQREETRPNAFTPNQLLSLLHPTLPTTTLPAPKANERGTLKKPRPPVAPSATESPLSQLPDIVNRRPTQRENEVAPEAPPSSRSTSAKLAKRQDIGSQRPRSTAAKSSHAELKGKGKQEDKLQQLVAECSWMKGFEFSRDAFRVPYSQRRLLDNENSWYKPQVGCLFPPDNIPIDVLDPLYKRADQQAAMDAAPDSDDEMEEDPSPESVDPSPESLVESVDPSPDSVPQPTQDDIQPPSSVRSVSWSQSPEPPVLSKRPDQGLPPDSSLANQENNHTDGIRRGSMGHDTQPPQLIVIESSDEEPTAPPSSPPAIEQAVDFDDEDMEESVPQGYGEDSTEGAVEPQARRSESASPHPKSVVQVRETPYARGKIAQLVAETASPRARKENSSGTSKHTSSTSIIYGTYNEATSAGPTQDQPLPKGTMDVFSTNGEMSSSDLMEAGAQVLELEEQQRREQQLREQQLRDLRTSTEHTRQDHALDVVMADAPADRQPRAASPTQEYERASEDVVAAVADNNDARSIQPDQNPIVAQLPLRAMNSLDIPASSPETRSNRQDSVKSATLANSPSLPPGSTKRKSSSSPSRKNKRQSRRREIKLVGFGKDAPFPTDPASTLRQDREDFKLVASHQSRTASATATGEQHNEGIMEIDPPAAQANIPAMSHQNIKDEADLADEARCSEPAAHLTSKGCLPDQRSPIVTTPTRSFPTVQTEKQVEPSTSTENLEYPIFKKFQATYPDYKGDVIHFKNQVEEMISLDKEDKMVPKWRWDDYIIRHTIDYRTSMLARMVNGQKPEPDYHRFYKDTIQDTLYKKGVLVNRTTLEEAWEELRSVTPIPVPVSRPVEQVHGQQALEQKRPEQQRPEQQRPERRRPERSYPEQPRSEPRSEQPLFEPSRPKQPRPKQPRPKQPRPGRQQQPTQSARKETQSRRSLPSAFNEHKSNNQTPINVSRQDRPRQSLPVKSQINHRTLNNQPSTTRTRTSTPSVLKNAPSTAIPSFLARLKLDDDESPRTSASGASTEGTGDPFKDIVFAHQRLKAFTGSTEVSGTSSDAAGRKS